MCYYVLVHFFRKLLDYHCFTEGSHPRTKYSTGWRWGKYGIGKNKNSSRNFGMCQIFAREFGIQTPPGGPQPLYCWYGTNITTRPNSISCCCLFSLGSSVSSLNNHTFRNVQRSKSKFWETSVKYCTSFRSSHSVFWIIAAKDIIQIVVYQFDFKMIPIFQSLQHIQNI